MGRPKQFTRDDVLRKALPVFWKQGFARASLPDLEHATGVNKSGLYAEFENKEKLYLECLRYYLNGRDGADFFAGEPLGWDNIQRFLEEGPSRLRGQRGCFAVSSMRELECLPREVRNVILEGRQTLRELMMRNVRAERRDRAPEATQRSMSAWVISDPGWPPCGRLRGPDGPTVSSRLVLWSRSQPSR